MPKLDLSAIAEHTGSDYPAPFGRDIAPRARQRLGEAGGLTQFGVNLLRLPPGCWSAQRHWHTAEDEFTYVLSGTVVLVTDQGEEVLHAGDCAAFPANWPNGHHLINRGTCTAVCLEVGSRVAGDRIVYSDIDMVFDPDSDSFVHRDGAPYPPA
ncbi:MAG: cupin domain-containing protein [Pseudomonadota bacterium]